MYRPALLTSPPPTSPSLFWAVVLTTLGWFGLGSVAILFSDESFEAVFSNAELVNLVLLELLLAALWVPALRRRGWSLACVTRALEWRDLARGVGLFAACYAAATVATRGIAALGSGAEPLTPASQLGLSVSVIVATSIVNAAFEEFIYLGFITNLLRPRGEQFAVIASVVTRTALHLYQGPANAAGILVLGTLVTFYYFRTLRLWPVVLAHAILDGVGLVTLVDPSKLTF